jgi:hypothetical protein
MTPDDLARGVRISAQLPDDLRTAASQGSTAVPVVLAMLLDEHDDVRDRQLRSVGARLGAGVRAACLDLAPRLADLPPLLRLPLAALAVPQLTARPPAERAALTTALDELARADGRITVFEYSLTRLVGAYLADAGDPVARSRPGRASVSAMRDSALTLLAAVSAAGNDDPAAAQHAFATAAAHLMPGASVPFAPPAEAWRALDAGWGPLNSLDPRNKQVLVEALVIAVSDDGVLRPAEAELLRTACAMLRCPLPPLLA